MTTGLLLPHYFQNESVERVRTVMMCTKRLTYFLSLFLTVTLHHLPQVNAKRSPVPSRSLEDSTNAAAYDTNVDSITLNDVETGIEDIVALHNGKTFAVVANLAWAEDIFVPESSNTLKWEMAVDGIVRESGTVNLTESRSLPVSIDAGTSVVTSSGTHTIGVSISLDGKESGMERNYQSFSPGASFVPLIVVLLLASTTQMVS